MSGKVVTRFAPSPTGKFHVGGVRSALFNYLYARKHDGTYILRCEDTDPVRSKKEYEEYFLEVFKWLGLTHDQYYRQSERTALYRSHLEKLISEGKAYVSKEEPKEVGGRTEVIRFKSPRSRVTFRDEVLGEVSFDTEELGDFVIARDMESPLYHFTVVVDDFEMKVTHIIRGQEHVSNTARQILLQEALGAPRPVYAHGSVILNQERAKLSKRDPLVRPVLEYRDEGYLPEALLNFMALLGWNPGTEQEIFTLKELTESFSFERMQKSGAVFDPDKLLWINGQHLKRLSAEAFSARLHAFMGEEVDAGLIPLLQERSQTLKEAADALSTGEYSFLGDTVSYDQVLLLKGAKSDAEAVKRHLIAVAEILRKLPDGGFTTNVVKDTVFPYATEEGRAGVLWPMRVALSGREKSPDPFTLAGLLGKEKTLERIEKAAKML